VKGKCLLCLPYLRFLYTCNHFNTSASASYCDRDGHACAAEYFEAKLRETEKKLQNAEACIEHLMHGSLQLALLPQLQIPVSVDGTMTGDPNISMSEPQPSSLQVPSSAILPLLSCLRPVAAIAQSHDQVKKKSQALTLSCSRPAAFLYVAARLLLSVNVAVWQRSVAALSVHPAIHQACKVQTQTI